MLSVWVLPSDSVTLRSCPEAVVNSYASQGDVPEERVWTVQHSFGLFLAYRRRLVPLPDMGVGTALHGTDLDLLRQRLLLGLVGLGGEGLAPLLHLLVARPADPRPLAVGVDAGRRDRVQDAGLHPRGPAGVPAACRRIVLLVPAAREGRGRV